MLPKEPKQPSASPSIAPSATSEEQLDEVIASYLKAAKLGQRPNHQEWIAQHPDLAAGLEEFFADRERFDLLAAPLRMIVPPSSSSRRTLPLTQVGNYELLEEIACGGMGVVYKARQINLNRIVALKMLRAGPQACAADLQRFRTEVEAVAQLDHPNIIPIYEVGEWCAEDGSPQLPYFSMKLVEEGSLAERVKSWAVTAGYEGGGRQIALLVVKVARAVHCAHQHGILHRDLKPANILVDGRGEPYVTDFGLAKRLPSVLPIDDTPHLAQSAIETPLTETGSVLGTPGYMAPEQAVPSERGKKGAPYGATTASDVYSLGAILYELLTGRQPFQGLTPFETVRQLLETEPSAPRAINAEIHRDLETICLKCLEKDPSRRYGSVHAFADDLEHFLAGEPILARPAGNLERAWRWCRRKPVIAGLAACLALTVLLAFVLISWQWRRAEHHHQLAEGHFQEAERQWLRAEANLKEANHQKEQAETNLSEAQVQQARAEESFRLAHQAVNDFCISINDARVNVPALQSLRKKVLETGLNYYKVFLKQHANDPQIKEELAATQFRVGRLAGTIGSKVDSLAAFEQARNLYQELLHDKPDHLPFMVELAHTCNNIGVLQVNFERREKALSSFEQSRDLWEQVIRESPQTPKYRADLAIALHNLGSLHGEAGRPAEALAAIEKARTIREKLVQENPKVLELRKDLGQSYDNLAVYHAKAGQFEESFNYYRKSSAIFEELVRENPNNSNIQTDLAISYRRLAGRHNQLETMEERQKAKELLEKSRAILERMVKNEPEVIRFQGELGLCCSDLGTTCQRLGQQAEAVRVFQRTKSIFEKMVANNPTVMGYRRELAKSHYNLGDCYAGARDYEEATNCYERAQQIQKKLVQDFPGNQECCNDLALTLEKLASISKE